MAEWDFRIKLPGDLATEIVKRNRKAADDVRRRSAKHLANLRKRNEGNRWRPVRRFFDPAGIEPVWSMLMAHEPGKLYRPHTFRIDGVGNEWSPSFVLKPLMVAKARLGCFEQIGPNPAPSWDVITWRLTPSGEKLRDALIERCRQGMPLPTFTEALNTWRLGGLVAVLALGDENGMTLPRRRAAERFQERQRVVACRPRALLPDGLLRGQEIPPQLASSSGWLDIPVAHSHF